MSFASSFESFLAGGVSASVSLAAEVSSMAAEAVEDAPSAERRESAPKERVKVAVLVDLEDGADASEVGGESVSKSKSKKKKKKKKNKKNKKEKKKKPTTEPSYEELVYCPICGEPFTTHPLSFFFHLKRVHPNDDPLWCWLCEKSIRLKKSIKMKDALPTHFRVYHKGGLTNRRDGDLGGLKSSEDSILPDKVEVVPETLSSSKESEIACPVCSKHLSLDRSDRQFIWRHLTGAHPNSEEDPNKCWFCCERVWDLEAHVLEIHLELPMAFQGTVTSDIKPDVKPVLLDSSEAAFDDAFDHQPMSPAEDGVVETADEMKGSGEATVVLASGEMSCPVCNEVFPLVVSSASDNRSTLFNHLRTIHPVPGRRGHGAQCWFCAKMIFNLERHVIVEHLTVNPQQSDTSKDAAAVEEAEVGLELKAEDDKLEPAPAKKRGGRPRKLPELGAFEGDPTIALMHVTGQRYLSKEEIMVGYNLGEPDIVICPECKHPFSPRKGLSLFRHLKKIHPVDDPMYCWICKCRISHNEKVKVKCPLAYHFNWVHQGGRRMSSESKKHTQDMVVAFNARQSHIRRRQKKPSWSNRRKVPDKILEETLDEKIARLDPEIHCPVCSLVFSRDPKDSKKFVLKHLKELHAPARIPPPPSAVEGEEQGEEEKDPECWFCHERVYDLDGHVAIRHLGIFDMDAFDEDDDNDADDEYDSYIPGSSEEMAQLHVSGKRYLSKYDIVRIFELGDDDIVECPLCKNFFSPRKGLSLLRHLRLVHPAKDRLWCWLCNDRVPEIANTRNAVSKHFNRAHLAGRTLEPIGKGDNCKQCGLFTYCLETHYRDVHPQEVAHLCHICGETFDLRNKQMHGLRHQFRTCKYCNLRVPALSLQKHIKVHERRSAMCPDCGITISEDHLQTHRRKVHHPHELIPCPHCPKKFVRRLEYDRHLEEHSPDAIEYACEYCSFSTTVPGRLKIHLKSHMQKPGQGRKKMKKPRYGKRLKPVVEPEPGAAQTMPVKSVDPVTGLELLTCALCGFVCDQHWKFKHHRALEHGGKQPTKTSDAYMSQVHGCPICNEVSEGVIDFMTHMMNHTMNDLKALPGPHDGQFYRSEKSPTGLCLLCGKPVHCNSITRHLQFSHHQLHRCPMCSKSIQSYSSFQNHVAEDHSHADVRRLEEFVDEPFYRVPDTQTVICVTCAVVIPLNSTAKHLRNNHHMPKLTARGKRRGRPPKASRAEGAPPPPKKPKKEKPTFIKPRYTCKFCGEQYTASKIHLHMSSEHSSMLDAPTPASLTRVEEESIELMSL